MSTQNDLLDGSDSNLERLSNEVPEQSDMCLNWQDVVDNNFPNCEPDACGDSSVTTKRKLVEILEYRYFAKHIVFTGEGEMCRNKYIKDYVTVKVVFNVGCGNTRN